MKKIKEERRHSYLSLIEKMEKLDRDMREVKEALLTLRQQIIQSGEFGEFYDATTISNEEKTENE